MPHSRWRSHPVIRERVLLALRHPAAVFDLPPGDLDLTLRSLRRVRLLGRFAARTQATGLLDAQPRVVADQLLSALVSADARRRVAMWELNRVAWALGDLRDVQILVLKGCAYVLSGTPNAHCRMFADVDLLVPEERLAIVESQLRDRGWQSEELTPYDDRYYRRWTHELPPIKHPERGVEVDLHHGILMRTARLKPASALLFEAAREVPGSRFRLLDPVDMVLHAIVHLFYGGEMDDALRELVDIDDLLRHFAATEPGFWRKFWPRAVALDLARPAFYGLRYARSLLGAPVPDEVTEASTAGAPSRPVLRVMDSLVPKVLFPQHPDSPDPSAGVARSLLYIRSHWVKMPPGMLLRHLGYKSYLRWFQRDQIPLEKAPA